MTFQARTCSRGVTLLELIVVISILSIMLGVMTPLFRNSYTNLEIRNAYKNIAAVFGHAQERAIMEEREFRINFDRRQGAYWLSYRDDPMEFPAKFVDLNTDAGRVRFVPGAVKLTFIEGAKYDRKSGARSITFYPNGTADRATVQFRSTSGDSFRIETAREAGMVSIKER